MSRTTRLKKGKKYIRSAYKLRGLPYCAYAYKLRIAIENVFPVESMKTVVDVNEEFRTFGAYVGNPGVLSKDNKDIIVASKISSMQRYLEYCHLENFKSACIHAYTAQKDSSYLSKLKRTLLDDISAENALKIDPLMNYLSEKISSFVLNTVLVEVAMLQDCLNAPEQLDQNIKAEPTITGKGAEKYSNMSSVFLDFLNKRQTYYGGDYFYTATEAHTPIKRMREKRANAEKVFRPDSNYYETFPEVGNYYMVDSPKTAKGIISNFKKIYKNPFSVNEYLKNDIAFLFMMNPDYVKWLPETLGLYISYLLRYIGNDNFLYMKLEKYKQKRNEGKNHDPGSEFDRIAKAYTCMAEEIQGLLFELIEEEKDLLKYTCNKFLFSNLLHPNFCASLSSNLFEDFSKRCNLSVLNDYDDALDPTDEETDAAIVYNFLLLLLKYDINLKELEKQIRNNGTKGKNDFDFGKLQLVYNFLSFTDRNIGKYINDVLDLYKDSSFSHPNYWIENISLLRILASEITRDLPSDRSKVFPENELHLFYDNKQRELISQLLLHFGCKGWLFTTDYSTDK